MEKSQGTLKLLNVSVEDALVTDIKDLILDSKALLTDAFKLIDLDSNGLITFTELINGYLSFIESMQVEVKPEFKESIHYVTEIIKVSDRNEISLPRCKIFFFFLYF